MKFKYLAALLALIAILGGAVYFSYKPLSNALTLGLDIKGGITVLLEAVDTANAPVDDESVDRAIAIISNRINGLGVTEPEIQKEGSRRIRISLPGYENQEEVLKIIGKTALLEFRDMDGKVFLTGSSLLEANEMTDTSTGGAYVQIKLDEAGGQKMREYTRSQAGKGYLVITLDGELVSAPLIEEEVGAEGVINNISSLAEARSLAILLKSGALPVELKVSDFRAVGPTLGEVYLQKSIFAGIIGICLVFLFMIVFYRAFGLMASVALSLYTYLTLTALVAIKATLTLPGIAGIILGIGMAVDANIIIFERIKDEMKLGKTIRAAVKAGFHRAMSSVIDSNVTTLIAGAVLYYFGTGSVRGFAVTLSLGVIISMLTAVIVTRLLINLLVNANVITSPAILGVGGGKAK